MPAGFVTGLELRGAYGRETKMADWVSGKDFKITGGPYCSNRDVEMMAKEFDILEFVNHDGSLVERIILNQDISIIMENQATSFIRV